MIALLATMAPTAQRSPAHDIAQVPATHVHKLSDGAGTSGLLFSLAGDVGEIRKWAA